MTAETRVTTGPYKFAHDPTSGFTKANWLKFQRETFDEIISLTKAKNSDYTGGTDDPFANFRMAEEIGMTALHGLVLRMGDKWQRVKSYMAKGELAVKGEGIEDAFRDMIGYSVLALGLIEESKKNGKH